MTNSGERMEYIEGSTLPNGWHYRIYRIFRADGEVEYTGLLSHRDVVGGDKLSFLCLSRYASIKETRLAVYKLLPTTVRAVIASMERLSFLTSEPVTR